MDLNLWFLWQTEGGRATLWCIYKYVLLVCKIRHKIEGKQRAWENFEPQGGHLFYVNGVSLASLRIGISSAVLGKKGVFGKVHFKHGTWQSAKKTTLNLWWLRKLSTLRKHLHQDDYACCKHSTSKYSVSNTDNLKSIFQMCCTQQTTHHRPVGPKEKTSHKKGVYRTL